MQTVTEDDLKKLYTTILKQCLDIAIQRGYEYNADGNMIGSYSEYSIDDIASIIKVKAIRVKNNPANTKIVRDSCIDMICYACEVLRRVG